MATKPIITKIARKKMVMARAGALALPKIIGMAFGDGGVDSNRNTLEPVENQAELNHEIYRQEIDNYKFIDETTCQYRCTLTESTLNGAELSEVGLYDEEGDIICIKSFTKKGKDDDLEMTFTLDDVF